MQFKSSPFVEQDKAPTKSELEQIDVIVDREFDSYDKKVEQFKKFFGLYYRFKRKEGGGEIFIHDGEITEEDIEKFATFAKHNLKEILLASQKKDGSSLSEFTDDHPWKIQYHDLSHVFGSLVSQEETSMRKFVVPPILNLKKGYSFNNVEVITNELYGVLLYTLRKNNGEEVNMTLETLYESESFEEFASSFLDESIKIIRKENEDDLREFLEKSREAETEHEKKNIWYTEKEVAFSLLENLRNNPPAKLLELLQYIWEHKDNPRVLVDLFFKEAGPYIEKLRKQKEHSVS